MAKRTGKFYLGTSGWMYKDWGARFYPEDLKKKHLGFYAQEFDTVEINTSFYHLPLKKTFRKWTQETPEDFRFAVKLSRFITHQKRLSGVRGSLEKFIKHAEPMQEKLGVVLVQLPPTLRYEEKTFARFLEDIRVVRARNYPVRFALEPRHRSWDASEHKKEIRKQLKTENIALVFAQSKSMLSIEPKKENITADFVYVRFHGPEAFAASLYGKKLLKPWAQRMARWRERGCDVFAYFNNDKNGHAITDARTLTELLKK